MDYWRRVEPDVALFREARMIAAFLNCNFKPRFFQPPQQMGAWGDKKRRIVDADVVEVNSNRYHPRQQIEWRNDVQQSRLHRPRTESRCFDPLTNGDDTVLVPIERPVRLIGLVEIDRANGLSFLTKD